MAEKNNFKKRRTADNHELSKLDFYRRCASLMKSKDRNIADAIKYEFEKQLDYDSPYVFYSDNRGYCINTDIALRLLECILENLV